jgi:hypothetical protein
MQNTLWVVAFLFGLIAILFWTWTIADVAKRKFEKPASKAIWLVIVIVTFLPGAFAYHLLVSKKDDFKLGAVFGLIGPLIGLLIFKYTKFVTFSYEKLFEYLQQEQGHKTISVALSLALLINALLFTFCINGHRDKTAKGIFTLTCVYGLAILLMKTFF